MGGTVQFWFDESVTDDDSGDDEGAVPVAIWVVLPSAS
jgi:hypothetical protein